MAYKHKDCVNSWVVSKKKTSTICAIDEVVTIIVWTISRGKIC